MRRALIIATILVIVIGGLFLAQKKRAPKPAVPTTQQLWASNGIPVETSTIVRGDMEHTAEVNGDIAALKTATLSSKISGRIASVFVREGDRVSAGETIAILDQDDPRSNLETAEAGLASAMTKLSQAKTNVRVTKIQTDAAIEQAEANLASAESKLKVVKMPQRTQERLVAENNVSSAKADLDNAVSNYKRNAVLLKEGAISPSAFDPIKSAYLVAKANYKSAQEQLSMIKEGGRREDIASAESAVAVSRQDVRSAKANASQNMLRQEDVKSAIAGVQQAKATLAIAKQQLENTYIKSPIAGQVSSRLLDPGQVVSAGQSIVSIVNMDSLYFKGDVSENALGDVAIGQRVRVGIDAISEVSFMGTVAQIYPAGSTTNRNFSVRINLKSGLSKIKPGMFARGQIITDVAKNILLIPKDAVDERKGTKSVYTIGTDNTAKRHIVDVIRENRNYVEIQSPTDLKYGDLVATQGRQNLQDGSKVLITTGK